MRNRRIRNSKDRKINVAIEAIDFADVKLTAEEEAALDESFRADMEDVARQILEEMESK